MNNSFPNIGIIQHNPKVGDISGNLKKILDSYKSMAERDIDIVLTSELSILGYPPRDLLHRKSIIEEESDAVDKIKQKTQNGPCIIVGHTSPNKKNGPPLKNSASVFKNGKKVTQYDKRLLPTYDVFDEHRYFKQGEESKTFKIDNYTVGLTICEDAWYDHKVTGNQRHESNPLNEYNNCDILVNLSASPFKIDKFKNRENRFANHSKRLNAMYIFANQVGGNDDILFDGSSFIVNKNGDTIFRGQFGEYENCVYKGNNKLSKIPNKTEQLRKILKKGIEDYLSKTGFKDVVIGLSGGIDSTVVANLAVDAIGKDNVHGVTLPSSITSDENLTDAEIVANNLGIRFDKLEISDINDKFIDSIKNGVGSNELKTVTKENIQARIRGVILMGIANDEDKLVLTPDNKSEAAIGYCTLYGDAIGAIAPLGDCTKNRVYNLADCFNSNPPQNIPSENPIPDSVINKEPTAELSEGQKDSNEIPPYDIIDDVVKMYVEGDKTIDEIHKSIENADKGQVSDIVKRITRSEFKRKQSPPSLRVTDKSFDSGWRYPIAASYKSITR